MKDDSEPRRGEDGPSLAKQRAALLLLVLIALAAGLVIGLSFGR